jgi:hypothetical protein
MTQTLSRTLPAYAQRPWGKKGDDYAWTAALQDRLGAVHTWYCNSREAAEYTITHYCNGAHGNTGTLAHADNDAIAPVRYAFDVATMKAQPIR